MVVIGTYHNLFYYVVSFGDMYVCYRGNVKKWGLFGITEP